VRSRELAGPHAVRWRFRGAAVSPEKWLQAIWQSNLAQFLVIGNNDPRPQGLVWAYNANFQDGHAYFAVETFDDRVRSPLVVLGTALFLDYVFRCWNFHKLYVEAAEYNLRQFQSATTHLLMEEGRLRDHLWSAGRRWDQVILALYRDTWVTHGERVLAAERTVPAHTVRLRVPMR
jgi:hypothetical protein